MRLARTLRTHRDGILAAIRLGLSNGRLEGLNSRIRLLSHRAFGFHFANPLIALVYLRCAAITIELPRCFTPKSNEAPVVSAEGAKRYVVHADNGQAERSDHRGQSFASRLSDMHPQHALLARTSHRLFALARLTPFQAASPRLVSQQRPTTRSGLPNDQPRVRAGVTHRADQRPPRQCEPSQHWRNSRIAALRRPVSAADPRRAETLAVAAGQALDSGSSVRKKSR
jgi:Transposase